MVLVNKVEEMKTKSVYYSKMPQDQYTGTNRLQSFKGMQTLNDPYDRLKGMSNNHVLQYYIMVVKRFHQGKYLANIFSMALGVIAFTLFVTALANPNYRTRVFPSSFATYHTKTWKNMTKVDHLISTLAATASPSERIRLVWEWGGCSKYITPNQIPKTNHPATLVTISSSDPIYLPGGCNCLAQVAGTMPAGTFTTLNPYIPYEHIKNQFEFCTLFAPMPTELIADGSSIRVDTYLYAFIFISLVAVIASNYRHWFLNFTKDNFDVYREGTNKFWSNMLSIFMLILALVVVITYNTYCKDCDADLKTFNWTWNFIGISLVLFATLYFANSAMMFTLSVTPKSKTQKEFEAMQNSLALHNVNAAPDMDEMDLQQQYRWRTIMSVANSVAGEEQLIFDAISVPALFYLTVAITVLRSWLDTNIIYYNVTLVLFLTSFYMASNYMSAKWSITYNVMNTKVNDEFQLFKFCSFFAGLFIIFSLLLTALPGVKPNYYHLDILDNWWFFIIVLFGIYVFPDIVSELKSVNLQLATAFRQWVLLAFVSFVIILQITVLWVKQDLFANSVF